MKSYLRPQTVALIALACGVAATLGGWFVVGRQVEIETRAEDLSDIAEHQYMELVTRVSPQGSESNEPS